MSCFECETGKLLFYTNVFVEDSPAAINLLNSYATPTPIVEPERIYCEFGTFGTACLDSFTGAVLWKRQFSLDHHQGPGSSPALFKNLLVSVRDGRDEQYVIALNKQAGDVVWKRNRPPINTQIKEFRKSFSTPLFFEVEPRTQVVIAGAQWLVSYDPETGNELWRVDDLKGETVAPRPVYGDGVVYLSTGIVNGRAQLWALRMDGQGDVTRTHVAWKLQGAIGFMPSPALVGQNLFLLSDDGFVSFADVAKGETLNKFRAGGSYAASPGFAERRIYCFSREGKTVVLGASRELTLLGVSQRDGPVFAPPAFVDASIYIRTDSYLYRLCVDDEHPRNGTDATGAASR